MQSAALITSRYHEQIVDTSSLYQKKKNSDEELQSPIDENNVFETLKRFSIISIYLNGICKSEL